ncbi:MAG: hypothetical protein DCC74_11180 [Proteobacteria bacterium]|nr:MAG: hypothetical protein DCC74_11180 [Pseudomonadota bacterium]
MGEVSVGQRFSAAARERAGSLTLFDVAAQGGCRLERTVSATPLNQPSTVAGEDADRMGLAMTIRGNLRVNEEVVGTAAAPVVALALPPPALLGGLLLLMRP